MTSDFYNYGLEKAKQKDYAGAIEDFNQAIQLDPFFSAAYMERGLAYYNSGTTLQAVFDYTEAIKLDGKNAKAYYLRALAKLTLKNIPGALEDVDKAIHLQLNDAAAYDLRGIVQRKQGNIQDAIANFKKAAALYLEQKDKENARLCLDKITQLQPAVEPLANQSITKPVPIISTQDYFTQLLEKAEQGDTKAALADLNWILKADTKDAQAYCCRGVVYCKMGNYRDAISDFNQALALNFQDAIVYRNRGKARSQLGDHQGGLADINQAMKMQPEDSLAYIARGNVYHSMGNYLAAIQDYSQAIQINPEHPLAYYNRALSYTCLEEISNAVIDYQKAASIYCEREDWENYQQVLNSLQKIQSSVPEINKASYNLLRQRLLRMVGGHWEIAQRLIEQKKDFFPGMLDEWYLQQVINDLERDRP
ncbi:tetratricopeptide repeat protein [Sphaerospermopsis aphanizomenoides BCCUSP55]|uniref:tetratricopeptide repeat protein n=1 Tax=Sphaerospermopsis aphanizomenoides TaxID=459663 RepID=UPI001908E43A|nr:tetratricopeptide repeat protein [Sphaerospermopsis aphanizomenoides]MBK1988266.1 tetratricopeptide repeat protein [Sphaerospermopsis aphanizomenoides BCCUSP55]